MLPLRAYRAAASMRLAFVVGSIPSVASVASAHGETTRGGGGATNTTGAMITLGMWTSALRFEVRHYDQFDDAQLLGFAGAGEDVHQHAQEFSRSLSSSYAF